MARFEGKVAIVTGGARGIGLAVCRRFVDEGAQVVVADIDEEAGEAAAEELGGKSRAVFIECDVGEPLDARNLVAEATSAFTGDVDVLVNNAGIVHAADFLDLKEADFDRVLRVNLKGAFLVGQAAARRMVEQAKGGRRGGAIVNMSSINDRVAIPTQVPYCVSKGGLAQLTRVMALALAPHGIRVNAIGPGSIMTDLLASIASDKEARKTILSRTPLRRIGEPDEVAAVCAFLASADAAYVTGETVYVDGGRLGLNYVVAVPDDG